jgi:nucleotide-binding universal stress UspA family protein
MKSILVPTENRPGMTSTLETALLLAQRCGGYIEGFPLRSRVRDFIALDPTGSVPIARYEQESQEEVVRARTFFKVFMQERNLPSGGKTTEGLSYGWFEDAAEGEDFVGSYGRVFDIIVLGRPDADTSTLHNRAIESALFESGRSVLLTPPIAPREIAANIMVHWNRSTEQARATDAAMPLLQRASRVTVLDVNGGQGVSGPSAAQLIKYFERSGISADLLTVGLEGRSTGEAVLRAAAAQGCDLLVKGAYTQSRLRQMIFGGATSHILANAELPVLMAH